MRVVNKDIVKQLCKRTDLDPMTSNEVLDEVFTIISAELDKGNEVIIQRFGVFRITEYIANNLRNPYTQEAHRRKKIKRIRFRPSTWFKKMINSR